MSSNEPEEPALELKWKRGLPILLTVIIVALVVMFVAFGFGGGEQRRASGTAQIGAPAPEFSLTALDGARITLSDHLGTPVIVHFLASWCERCRDDLELLVAARAEHATDDLAILGIAYNDEERDLREPSSDADITWPLSLDPNATTWASYQAIDVPATYFIDADMILRAVSLGPLDETALRDHLESISVRPAN